MIKLIVYRALKIAKNYPYFMFKIRGIMSGSIVLNIIFFLKQIIFPRLVKTKKKPKSLHVIGIGVASLAFIEEFRRYSNTPITVVSSDMYFGGKCVHFGCIVIEVIKRYRNLSLENILINLSAIKNDLNGSILNRLNQLGVTFIIGKVVDIKAEGVVLEDGRIIQYDTCVFGTGNVYKIPQTLMNSNLLVSVDEVWNLPLASKILLYTKNNIYAISMASALLDLGHEVTLLLDGAFINYQMPSLLYLLDDLKREGLQLYLKSRIIRAQDSKVVIECETGVNYLNVDKICALSEPVLNLPKYNGTKLLGAHIDKEMCILGNQNLRVIGDSSGTMTVTEAEYISRQVAKSILNGIPIQYEICSFPQKIESKLPLCISGEMDTMYIAAEKWRYVDFKFLGWSLVRRTSGRLWYLFDAKTEKITAMHIYHERSVELISLATLLMKYKITDRVWEESMLHPSPVEIFMTLSKRIIDEMRL